MTTVIRISQDWQDATSDINSWFSSKGYSVIFRVRSNGIWDITLNETLNQSQKDNLSSDVIAELAVSGTYI